MLSPRWRKIISDVTGNRLRTLLVVLSITVGVMAVGMILGSSCILSREMARSFGAINPASAILVTEPLDEAALEAVRALPSVSGVEGRTAITVRVEAAAGEGRNLTLYALPNYDEHRISRILPEAGAWPPPANELLLERGSVDYLNSAIGQALQIETPSGEIRSLAVAGTVHDLYRLPGAFNGGGVAYVTTETLVALGGDPRSTEIHTLAAQQRDDRAAVEAMGREVRLAIERSGARVDAMLIATPDQHPLGSIVQAIVAVLGVMGLLALLLSGLLVVNTIQALLKQQTRQIGVMKAIGASRGTIFRMYLRVIMLLSLIALLLGLPLAALGARWFTRLLASNLNFTVVDATIPPAALLAAAIVGLCVPLLAAIYPILAGTGVTVREAITDYGVDSNQFGNGLLDRLLQSLGGLARPTLLAVRNTFRSKGRLAMTLITLTLASAISIAVFSVQASLTTTLDETMAYFGDDVSIELTTPAPNEQILAASAEVAQIERVELWGQTPALWIRPDGSESDSAVLWAPPADTATLRPTLLEGRWLEPGDTNAVVINTYLLSDEHPIQLGDAITLRIQGQEAAWQVVGIIGGVPNGIPPAPYLYVPYAAYTSFVGEEGTARRIQVITTDHSANARAVAATDLAASFKQAGLPFKTAVTANELRTAFTSVFTIIVVLLLVMAVLLAVVGGLGLTGTMSLSVLERRREIGIMRSVGATSGAIRRIVVIEGLTIGLLSWLFGALLAIPLSKLLSDTVGMAFMQAPLSYAFSLTGVLIWLVVVAVIATIASLIPAFRAARLPIREVLAYE